MHTPLSTHAPRGEQEHLEAWCALFEDCERIESLVPRQQSRALGVIQRLRLIPGVSIEATLYDGTGRLTAVWTGEPLHGLELGRGLLVEGCVCMDSGRAVMRNPTWRLVRDPYACAELAG